MVTSAEAESPRRDIPVAARYMYLLPVGFYLIAILLVGLCIDYLNPLLPHQHIQSESLKGPRLMGYTTAESSPFVIAIVAAGISVLPNFLNAAFLISALTAAWVRSSRSTHAAKLTSHAGIQPSMCLAALFFS